MNELNDKHMLRSLRRLSTVEPDPARTRAALAAARRTLLRRRVMKLSFAGGIAAAVVIAIGVMFSGTNATAAEALAKAAQTSKAYKGWVHERMGKAGDKVWSALHFNTESGAWISEVHSGNGVEIQMYLPADGTEVQYNSEDKTVRIGGLYEGFAANWKKMVEGLPLTAAENIAAAPDSEVKQSTDGGLARFDVRAKPSKAGTRPASAATDATFWCDPKTNLVKRGRATVDGQVEEFSFTYGEPAIRDVYDLGVPRDAKVVDARPAKDVGQLLARLQKRVDGFGDYVAVLTEQTVDAGGKPIESGGSMWLLAQQGDAYVASRFLVSDMSTDEQRNPKRIYGKVPEGWPAPKLDAALEAMKSTAPTNFLVSDGKQGWSGFELEPGSFQMTDLNDARGSQMVANVRAQSGLPGRIWPTRIGLGAFGAGAQFRTLTDPAKPGLIGLELDQTYPGAEMKPTRALYTYWLDPAKDDISAESTSITYEGLTAKEYLRFDTKRHEFAKTDAGKWYPAEWTTVTVMHTPVETRYYQKSRLMLWPAEKLAPEWFRKPPEKPVAK